jgi:hypothetical protein
VGENITLTTGDAESSLGHDTEYKFAWGDGQTSSWGSNSRQYIYSTAGVFQIRAQARCKNHTTIVSDWSSSKTVTISAESVSSPNIPLGPSTGVVDENLTFFSEGAESNLGHDLHFQFVWGDGKQSDWGDNTQQYSYSRIGNYKIRTRARCSIHPDVVSGWSDEATVLISPNQYQVSGKVVYYSNQSPIENVTVDVSGDKKIVLVSDEQGGYDFIAEAKNDLMVTASKPAGEQINPNDITVYDAVLTARHVYQYEVLSPDQQIAADADMDGSLSLYDAVQIARFVVGRPLLNTSHVNEWLFKPNERLYQDINETWTDQDFRGYIVGNVHGGWFAPGTQKRDLPISRPYIGLKIIRLENKEILIPLHIEGKQDVLSAEILIEYNSDELEFSRYEKTELTQNSEAVFNNEPGKFHMGIFSTTQIRDSGNFINIVFELRNEMISGTHIELKKFLINNEINYLTAETIKLNYENLSITNFSLFQNYPNPFNATTKISFEIPEKGKVELNIFNDLGQFVKTLLNEIKEPGSFVVYWDGYNYLGEKEASGIKFYKIIYNNKVQTKKMIILN